MSDEFIPIKAEEADVAEVEHVEPKPSEPVEAADKHVEADVVTESVPAIATAEVKEEVEVKEDVAHANGEAAITAAEVKSGAPDLLGASEILAAAAARAQALASQFASDASNADLAGNKRKIEDGYEYGAPDAKRHASEVFLDRAPNSGTSPLSSLQQAPAYLTDASGEISETINAPSDKVGRLIGKGGATIQAIQARGGCKIKVQQEEAGGFKPVTLSGTPESVARTKALCMQALETGSIEGGPISPVVPTSMGAVPTPVYIASSMVLPLGSTHEPGTRKISCPAHMIGRVIGKNGETIRSLQTASSAAIRINQDFPEGAPREIEITGTFDSIQRAHDMILEIINTNGQATTSALINQVGGLGGGVGGVSASTSLNNQFGKGLVREITCLKTSIGRVIGKGGECVKALQRVHGCTIQIDQTNCPCKIKITGEQPNVMTAERAIMDLIQVGGGTGGVGAMLGRTPAAMGSTGGYGGYGGYGGPASGAPPHYPQAGGGHWPGGGQAGYGAWGAPSSYPGQGYGAWGAGGGGGGYSAHQPHSQPGGYGQPAPAAGGYPGQGYGAWTPPVDPYGQHQAPGAAAGAAGGYGQAGGYAPPAPAPAAPASAPGAAGGYPSAPPPPQRSAWQELKDDQKRSYYYNSTTGVSQWERPRDM